MKKKTSSLWDAGQAGFKRKRIALQHLYNLSFHLKNLEKEEEIKSNLSRRKKTINRGNQQNRKKRNNREKSTKPKSFSLRKAIRLISF